MEELALFRWEFEGPNDQPGERGRQVRVMKRFTFGRADGRYGAGEEGEGTNESFTVSAQAVMQCKGKVYLSQL